MRAFVIALDDLKSPKKSALLIGPEKDDDSVRKEFFAHRSEQVHPSGWEVLQLHSVRGIEAVSVARWKTKEAKAKALADEAKAAKDEAEAANKSKKQPDHKK